MIKQRSVLLVFLSLGTLAFIEINNEQIQTTPSYEAKRVQKINQLDSLSNVYKSIFNNKDLSGWIVYGTEKWYVENGLLVCESGPEKKYGYLGTDNFYKNFVLSLDFKQEANGNSGVFFRSTVVGTKVSGWQVEVAPPGLHTGGIYESYGRGWLIKPDEGKDSSLKMGSWNNLKVKVYQDTVTTWLNGKMMISLSDQKIGKANGRIALQIHDGGGIKVKWKNIKIQEL